MTNTFLSENLNSSSLKSFTINGLFGFKNIKINFDKETIILIAENGSGKTTILNCLYYSISGNFDKLKLIDFESITLEFKSKKSISINKSDINDVYPRNLFEYFSSFKTLLPSREIDKLEADIRTNIPTSILGNRLRQIFNVYNVPIQMRDTIQDIVLHYKNEQNKYRKQANTNKKIEEAVAKIQENLQETILYFPTYRRIEEDLKSLGYEEAQFERLNLSDREGKLIQFGMDDVSENFKNIEKTIKDSALFLFSKVTGEILTQFIEGSPEITLQMRERIQPDTLNIVLSRVGENNISTSDREKIEELVSSGKIQSEQYNSLTYFLSKLIGLYEHQKEQDKSIKQFAEICNQYLNKKQIVYDEANVNISIIQSKNDNAIDIKNLSSGEKQIISIFSKIYLESSESSKNFILLFDEPELSLSIQWQRLLLPDILNSGKCKLLLAVTHSPFIFDNELDANAKDLDFFIEEI